MGQMFHKTRNHRNNLWWDNPSAFTDDVDRSNLETTSVGKVELTCERLSSYGSDDRKAKIEPPSHRQYKPGNVPAVRPLNRDEILVTNDDDGTWANPWAPSGGRSRPADGNDSDDSKGGTRRGVVRQGPGTGQTQQMRPGRRCGKGWRRGRQLGTGRGRGRETVKGKVLLNKPQGEMISLMPLLCSCRRQCMTQTQTRRANKWRKIQSW